MLPVPRCSVRDAVRTASFVASVCTLLALSEARAQTAEEHASHHPDAAAGATPAAAGMPAGEKPAGEKPSGGMGDMGKMMEGMGKPPPKELYPSLMALPELTPEKRREVEQQSGERMNAGTVMIGQSLDALNSGAQSGDYAAMQDAATHLREGIAQLESGIAARRALAEGRAPREVALAWFKREMNLSLGAAPAAHGPSASRRSICSRCCCWSDSRSRCSPCTSSRCGAPRRFSAGSRRTKDRRRPAPRQNWPEENRHRPTSRHQVTNHRPTTSLRREVIRPPEKLRRLEERPPQRRSLLRHLMPKLLRLSLPILLPSQTSRRP